MNNGMMDGSIIGAMCFMMGFGLLLFFIIFGATVYTVVRMLMKKARVEDRPLMLLKERYVRGEMDEEEYSTKRNQLSKKY